MANNKRGKNRRLKQSTGLPVRSFRNVRMTSPRPISKPTDIPLQEDIFGNIISQPGEASPLTTPHTVKPSPSPFNPDLTWSPFGSYYETENIMTSFIAQIDIQGSGISCPMEATPTPLDGDCDWIGTFVSRSGGFEVQGARMWDTSICGNGICNVESYGTSEWVIGSEQQLQPGERVYFGVYRHETNEILIFNQIGSAEIVGTGIIATPNATVPFYPMQMVIISSLLYITFPPDLGKKKLTPDEFPGLLRQKGGNIGNLRYKRRRR